MLNSRALVRGKHVGRFISISWACLWIFLRFISVLDESQNLYYIFYQTAIPGFFFLGSSIIAWMHRKVGGTILMFEGLVIVLFLPMVTIRYLSPFEIFLATFFLSIPPMIAGYFFLRKHRDKRF